MINTTEQILRINIHQANKSIPIISEFFLPSFVILTGPNGSGKSHLFEALSLKNKSNVFLGDRKLENIRYIGFNQLNPAIDANCDPIAISQRIKGIWNHITQAKNSCGNNLQANTVLVPEQNPCFGHIRDQNMRKILGNISRKSNTPLGLLSEDIIGDYLPSIGLTGNELFNSQFAMIFKSYHVRQIDNMLNKMYSEQGEVSSYLSEEEFQEKYGEAPWNFVDRILDRLRLPYKVTNPEKTKRESTFKFELTHKEYGFNIPSNDLSTGEKTLMSLALAIYNTTNSLEKIDLLILDEPDAPLHPSMSKLMLEILEKDICEKHKIPVLLSTHSPATVACSPTQSLYKIMKDHKIPEPCTLDDSLNLLAYEISNFRVSVENRRQVFVEHAYDVVYYEKLFSILSKYHSFSTSPQFLPPHNRDGSNCTDVIKLITSLRNSGNNLVYGLIDHDGKNINGDFIKVLGNGYRYAIENYLFEPHLFALYMIKKGFINATDIGLVNIHNYVQISNLINNDTLQHLSNIISEQLSFSSEKKTSSLIDGNEIGISKEYFTMQGHELELQHKNKWPVLNSIRGKGDSALKVDIISTIINDFPQLLSKDILWTFNQFT